MTAEAAVRGIMVPEVVAVTSVTAPEKESVLALFPNLIRQVDPDVRDVILIGSAVYAPDLARDYDLVITTRSTRDTRSLFERLLDVLNEAADKPVDVILRRPGEDIRSLALGILAGCILFGTDETAKEARISFEKGGGTVGSFKHALTWLYTAEKNLQLAEAESNPDYKDDFYRLAFGALFHGAQEAGQTYLQSEDTRWGYIARQLPWPYDNNFREMIETLHILYSYDGKYPRDPKLARKEFDDWKEKVETFITELGERIKAQRYER